MSSQAPLRPTTMHALERLLGARGLRRDVVLAPFTTFKIGGPADLLFEAHTVDDLVLALRTARDVRCPHFLLGKGANVLVGDLGFRGLVIRNVADRAEVQQGAHRLWVESGATVYPDVIDLTIAHGLSGLEHYAGIPSTVGGALWQNLHFLSPPPERARTMFVAEVLEEAELLTQEGDRRTVDAEYFRFDYDYSILHDRDDVVLSATFLLRPADPARMRSIVEANLAWRRERHPPLDTEPSAGSIFKKIEGVGAGRLIDECGLLGARIGGAEITHRHANIIINREDATAADVRALIAFTQETVLKKTGYALEPEIAFVGTFASPTDAAPRFVPKPPGVLTAAERAHLQAESRDEIRTRNA